jgi:hypothetical protein
MGYSETIAAAIKVKRITPAIEYRIAAARAISESYANENQWYIKIIPYPAYTAKLTKKNIQNIIWVLYSVYMNKSMVP